MSLSAKIGLLSPYNADFHNRFYPIFTKNQINHCIEGTGSVTQFRPTPYLDECTDWKWKSRARGAQLSVTQRPTQTSCRAKGAGGFHN